MRVAHILLVHKNPQQIARLVERLYHPDVDCWVHIDQKVNTNDFKELAGKRNVFILQPTIRVDWGCFNTVEAMLFAMLKVSEACEKYAYFNFMSGQDYPLKPASVFFGYLKANPGAQFMNNRAYEESTQNIIRFRQYHFNDYSFTGVKLLERLVNKVLPQRRFRYPHEIRKGSQWMALSRDAVTYVLKFMNENPRYGLYFRRVHIPDEFFFQTILYNSPLQSTIRNPNLHYIDWTEKTEHPRLLIINDYDKLASSDRFFARKFDMNADASILDALDTLISKNGDSNEAFT